ncbi:hypothetical protein J4449_03845 [Candidatus Woesearchaeota archaeon]|nr:hypothetical protein [Candidatus Woesearchaeota archaeon]
MNFKKGEIIVIALAVMLFLGFIFLVKPSTTGYIAYTLVSNEYNYNSSLVNFSDNQIKLIPSTTTTITTSSSNILLSAATQNEDNKLSKVNSLNNESVNVEEDEEEEILDLTFASNLENNDVISAYIKHNKDTNVKICQPSNLCPNHYANLNYDGTPKYLNFTLNLSSERNTFGIFPTSEKIKIDYVYAIHFATTTNTTTIYPSSTTIETNDIEPANISRFDYFNYSHNLNDQNIEYYYSTDSGNNWKNFTDQNISALNLTKIKIRAMLFSNGTETPIIESLSLSYSETENVILEEIYITEIKSQENLAYLVIYSDNNLSDETINIQASNLSNPEKNKIKAVEINANNILFNSAILKINYTDEELGNINESSLKFYYYNESSEIWEEKEFTLNKDGNYIESNLSHFSVYGIFGDKLNQGGSNDDGTSGGSSGGSGTSTTSSGASSSGGGDRAPSSIAPEKRTIVIQNVPQREGPKEIKLFEESKEEKKKQDIITTQAVKEIDKINYLGIYFFIALVIILYFIYHKHVKKTNSKHEKTKIKKLKNHRFKVKIK